VTACLWCGIALPGGRRHGSARKFCSSPHRREFHAAARAYALAEIEAGRLSVHQLKECPQESAHASPDGGVGSRPTHDTRGSLQ